MGWHNGHLHAFGDEHSGLDIGIPFDHGFGETTDGRTVKVNQHLAKKGDQLLYEYDFGDGWMHLIEVQKVLSLVARQRYPQLLKGNVACPPEDCGGIWGYYDFVEAINDPKHESHEEMTEWMNLSPN
jgi:hypothetical protein